MFQGDAVDKFLKQRTSVIEYQEPITELPTIITYIDSPYVNSPGSENHTYGKDFNISFEAKGFQALSNLTFGENVVDDSQLRVYFESVYWGNHFIITPLNFVKKPEHSYILSFSFCNQMGISKVVMGPSSENNVISIDGNFRDGDQSRYRLKLGEEKTMTISQEKIVYLRRLGKCRDHSYNDELVKNYVKAVSKKCTQPCKSIYSWGHSLNKILENLPICTNVTEKISKCGKEALEEAKKGIVEDPCILSNYRADKSTRRNPLKNQATYEFVVENMAKVKEEYLIFDTVSMISVVGGFMGLCVGFSFYDTSGALLRGLEFLLKWKRKFGKNKTVEEMSRDMTSYSSKQRRMSCPDMN